jgi:uncharacterized membrane protein
MNATLRWALTVVAVAVLAHVGSTWYAPRYIMARTMDAIAGAAGNNVFIERPLADADSRSVVRPSPDLMYSLCVLDLAAGPVRIRAPASAPYTSVSVFAANTDNVFVQNDRALQDVSAGFDVWIAREGQEVPAGATVARLPSARGIALIRRVVTDAEQQQALETLRKQARCEAQA